MQTPHFGDESVKRGQPWLHSYPSPRLRVSVVRRHFQCFKPLGYLACEVRHFSHATGCTDDRQKRNLLLRTAGEEVQDVFSTLADTGATHGEAVAALIAHFQP